MTPTLDIIIVNWNAGPALRECLWSIRDSKRDGFTLANVVVVDNASVDGSAKNLRDLDIPLCLVENVENRGFAAACNQGACNSEADYLLFLNPDARLFDDTLAKSVDFMSASVNSSVGILGVQLIDDTGRVSRTCARFFTLTHFLNRMVGLNALLPSVFFDGPCLEWDHLESRKVDHVIGAYFFVRNCLFKTLSGFDERFFVYLEDIDFSLRAKLAGFTSYFLASAQCYHRGGGTSEQIKPRRLYYSLQSRILYGFKNFEPLKGWAVLLATLFVEPLSRVAQALGRASLRRVAETVEGYWLLWRAIPRLLRTARQK